MLALAWGLIAGTAFPAFALDMAKRGRYHCQAAGTSSCGDPKNGGKMRVFALLALICASPAFAADCDLPEGSVSADGSTVYVGSQAYAVRGKAARTIFKSKLNACGMPEAARRFEQWRGSRRAVNWEVGLGLLVAWPVLVGIPISGINGSMRKKQMIEAITERR